MRAAILLAVVLALAPSVVRADAVADANAGADALAAGQYERAVQLFTGAINSKRLSSEDLESAYVERGKAYRGEHNEKLALADFDRALALKPDDQEAFTLRAQAQGANTSPVSPIQQQIDAAKPLWQSGNCAGVEALLTPAALALDPYNPTSNFYHATCLVGQGDFAGAAYPLRLAVQYGADTPVGKMAQETAKRLASKYSPNGGIAMGCAVPVPPPTVDGVTATRDQILAAHDQLDVYVDASTRFQACLQGAFADMQAQATQQGGSYSGTALERKYQGAVDKNEQDQQNANDQYKAALAAYNAAHPRR
jgi:tetratricopeptide (TPR) repeat protein